MDEVFGPSGILCVYFFVVYMYDGIYVIYPFEFSLYHERQRVFSNPRTRGLRGMSRREKRKGQHIIKGVQKRQE